MPRQGVLDRKAGSHGADALLIGAGLAVHRLLVQVLFADLALARVGLPAAYQALRMSASSHANACPAKAAAVLLPTGDSSNLHIEQQAWAAPDMDCSPAIFVSVPLRAALIALAMGTDLQTVSDTSCLQLVPQQASVAYLFFFERSLFSPILRPPDSIVFRAPSFHLSWTMTCTNTLLGAVSRQYCTTAARNL